MKQKRKRKRKRKKKKEKNAEDETNDEHKESSSPKLTEDLTNEEEMTVTVVSSLKLTVGLKNKEDDFTVVRSSCWPSRKVGQDPNAQWHDSDTKGRSAKAKAQHSDEIVMSYVEKIKQTFCDGQSICENLDYENLLLHQCPCSLIEKEALDGLKSTMSKESQRPNENEAQNDNQEHVAINCLGGFAGAMVNARNEFKNNPSLSSNDQVKKDDVTTSSEGFADNHVPIHSRKIRQTPFQFRSQTTNDQRPKSDNNEITMYSAENNEMFDLFSQLDKLKEFITSSPSTSQSTYSQRLPTNSASVHKGKNDKPEGLNF